MALPIRLQELTPGMVSILDHLTGCQLAYGLGLPDPMPSSAALPFNSGFQCPNIGLEVVDQAAPLTNHPRKFPVNSQRPLTLGAALHLSFSLYPVSPILDITVVDVFWFSKGTRNV